MTGAGDAMTKIDFERERDYDAVFDKMVDDCRYFLTTHPLRSTRGWPLELHAIATAYHATYTATIGSRHSFSIAGWNSFKTGIENRMRGIHDPSLAPLPSSHMLISHTSGFYSYLTTFEKFAKARHLGSTELPDALLVEVDGSDDMRAFWRSFFDELSAQASNDLLFKV